MIGDLSYEYDEAGNRVAAGGSFARTGLPPALTSAVYDAANRAVQWGGAAMTYDDNGNLTSDGASSYLWNARDELASMSGASFQYDGLGRRTGKIVGGWTTSYLHDGLNVVAQFGAQAATLLTGLGIDETFMRTDSMGARHLLTDALGSTLALADGTGTVQTEYTFQPFGAVTVTGQPNANPFQFTGRENDDTGLYYYRARYYHPRLQRFISEDPIGYVDGTNLYAYSVNSPTNFADPTGETPWGFIFAASDLGYQLYENDWNLKCVNWVQVGLSGLGGGLTNALAKGAFRFKTVGSHTWKAASRWMDREGIQLIKLGQNRHHWLFERNQGIGKRITDAIKNQPWNTNPISARFNNWLSRHPSLAPLGAPSWVPEILGGAGLSIFGSENDCACR